MLANTAENLSVNNISESQRTDRLDKIVAIENYLREHEADKELLQGLCDIRQEIKNKNKRFGLVFEQHKEYEQERLESNLPILAENTKLCIDNGVSPNFLIEGDNLASLTLLLKTHKDRIDIIYIDPPYNTGKNDFIYDDKFIDKKDDYPHSKWLSFMTCRLKIARELLSKNGIIFISIDDNEQATLKLLCDEVFGKVNFVANMIWKKGGGKSDAKYISIKHEYILIYRKTDTCVLLKKKSSDANYRLIDKTGHKYCLRGFAMLGLIYTKSLDYPIETPDGTLIYPGNSKEKYENRQTGNSLSRDWCWTLSKTEFEKRKSEDLIVFKKVKGVWKVYYVSYHDGKESPMDSIYEEAGNQVGSIEMKDIFGDRRFDFPKPVTLIKEIISLFPNKSAIVLDFFAGSGTTGQAVMELNHEDGGERRFILCTNNENGICRDITYQRLKTVITGKRADGSEYSHGLPASLKYYKIEYVKTVDLLHEQYDNELLEHVREMVELENGVSFGPNSDVGIVLTKAELESLVSDITGLIKIKRLYISYNVLWDKYEKLFEKNGVEIIYIPEYYK